MLAQTLCYLTNAPITAWRATQPLVRCRDRLTADCGAGVLVSLYSVAELFQREIDWLCMRSVAALRKHGGRDVSYFLSDFPFSLLSRGAAAQIFLALVWARSPSHFRDSAAILHSLELHSWRELIRADPLRREIFARQLAASGSGGIHLLHALDKVARHARQEMPLIFVTELFSVAFVQAATRESLMRPACMSLFATACEQDARCISVLLREVCAHFRSIQRAAVQELFACIDMQVRD